METLEYDDKNSFWGKARIWDDNIECLMMPDFDFKNKIWDKEFYDKLIKEFDILTKRLKNFITNEHIKKWAE